MSETPYIQIPPNSTGEKIRHRQLVDLVVYSEMVTPKIGEPIVGKTSGATGVLIHQIRDAEITYYVKHTNDINFVEDELVWDGVLVDYASVQTTSDNVLTPAVHIADPDQPDHTQKVDQYGAALATFPEGTPLFDGFGRMQVSQMIAVGEYYAIGEDHAEDYWTDTSGGGSVTHDVNTSMMVYQTGTSDGDMAKRITNQYHPYKIGTSQLSIYSLALGDTGKANVVREWGYGDALNGVFFRLDGTVLEVVVRSDVTGSVVETIVTQANWNKNTLNNSVASDFVLDVSKANLYWIDFQWSGGVRFGVYTPDRRRITCHQMENVNKFSTTFLRTATLPLCWRQVNNGIAASTSEMRVTCGVIFTESADVQYPGVLLHTSPVDPVQFTDSENYVPFLSFRPKLTINGKPNRIIGFHETFDWAAIGNYTLHVAIFVKPPGYLADAAWSTSYVPGTMLEVDVDATTPITKATTPIESFVIGPNSNDRITLGDRIEKSFGLGADGTTQFEVIFAARIIRDKDDVGPYKSSLFYTKYWKEVR